ncbi:hypothetical protein TYRP_010292 [Tyrophagus putrescentiae]|nr:hypothetical protein TYRP_010292 [Tyrophagus putrescentiae]
MPEDEGAANEPITASKHQPFILFTSRVQQMTGQQSAVTILDAAAGHDRHCTGFVSWSQYW